MASEPESKIPVCPVCGGTIYHVANTWTTANGLIHRQRICALCELWAYQSVEKPEKVPEAPEALQAPEVVETVKTTPAPAETVGKSPKTTANANLADSGLTKTVQADNLTAKAGGRVPPWKRTRSQAAQPTRKG